jgi:hypothetical protein
MLAGVESGEVARDGFMALALLLATIRHPSREPSGPTGSR